ncbi:MAG: hypothetical protein AAGG75_06105 [Bacteroidota bacterium]
MERENYRITAINGSDEFKSFLLGYNIAVGTIFSVNYSPPLFKLVSINVSDKTLSLRKQDFNQIVWEVVS